MQNPAIVEEVLQLYGSAEPHRDPKMEGHDRGGNDGVGTFVTTGRPEDATIDMMFGD